MHVRSGRLLVTFSIQYMYWLWFKSLVCGLFFVRAGVARRILLLLLSVFVGSVDLFVKFLSNVPYQLCMCGLVDFW